MFFRTNILVLFAVLSLMCSACGSEIEHVPVKPNTEGSGAQPDDDQDDDQNEEGTEGDEGEGTEGDGNEGEGTEGEGNEGEGNEGEGTEGDGNEGDGGNENDNPTDSQYLVELSNADFEDGMSGWNTHNYKDATQATVEIVEGAGVGGSKCVKISQKSTNTVCCMAVERTLTNLKPETMYRMTAKVKYENVAKGCGAVIFHHNIIQYWNSSEYLLGTNMSEWTTATVDFLSDEKGSATICCALGYWLGGKQDGGRSTGTVYYDDVKVVEVSNELYMRSGKHMAIYIDPAQIKVPDASIDAWLQRVDDMYEAYAELVGATPYNGRKLGILTTKGIDKGYLALAGLPILWNGTKQYQRESFAAIHEHSEMDFGMMHEMGHCFNHVGNSSWNWNDEMFANFRMQYGLEKTGFAVYQRGASDSQKILYTGREILNMYKQDYDRTLNSSSGMNDNAVHYVLANLADESKLGWEPFCRTMKYLQQNGYSGNSNNWYKFSNFIDTLSRFATEVHKKDIDVWDMLSQQEIDSIKRKWIK